MEYNKIVALKYAQHFCKVANDRLKSKYFMILMAKHIILDILI